MSATTQTAESPTQPQSKSSNGTRRVVTRATRRSPAEMAAAKAAIAKALEPARTEPAARVEAATRHAPAVRQQASVKSDPVNPAHYLQHPSGVQCIDITEHMTFNLGNSVKYIWRADHKGDAVEDLKKARWYLDREINNRETAAGKDRPA